MYDNREQVEIETFSHELVVDDTSRTMDPKFTFGESAGVNSSNSERAGWKRFLGMILTTLSALTFSLNALILKLLNHFHPFNLGLWTFILMVLFSLVEILWRKCQGIRSESVKKHFLNSKTVALLWLRASLGVCALILFFYAMKFIYVADALLIDSTSPIFVHILAFILLKEKCGLGPTFSTILAILGIALITRPPILMGDSEYDGNILIGSVLAFGCMICITFAIIVLKFLENVPQSLVNLVLGCWGTMQCLVLCLWLDVLEFPQELKDVWKILATSVLFFLGQALITSALKHEEAGRVGLLRTTEVFFAFVWQFIFLDVTPDVFSIFGAILIMGGVFVTLFTKLRTAETI